MRYRDLCYLIVVVLTGCTERDHKVGQCTTPLSHWRKPIDGMNHHAIPNSIRIDDKGVVTWNGVQVTNETLVRYINESAEMNPLPFLILDPSPAAPCDKILQVRAAMDAQYCKMHWACGEGRGTWESVMDLPSPQELQRLESLADDMAARTSKRK